MAAKPWFRFLIVVLVFIGLASLLRFVGKGFEPMNTPSAPRNSILRLDLEGVIMNGKKFLQTLKDYSEDKNVKAIVININSPGGSVGPSQEINAALRRVREEHKIPVICSSSGLMASGAYYAAVACDKIVVSPGALVGSIGVIMEFANLEKLYDWAKVSRYSITSGKYKDSGAEYRPMREDERHLFQDLISEVYGQFTEAIVTGRPNLKKDVLTEYADGRVFTGAKAVKLGFADAEGSFDDAVNMAAEAAGLEKDKYELFKAPKARSRWWSWASEDEDPINGFFSSMKGFLKLNTLNKPMYLMPGSWE
ncbi:MAG: signal peptide peptidase SppA [Bdellovibrionaceae bacterium]|nr:signal peptide peptidase SppA [Pseudobdellovibrionaceae bacterium]MBX3033103.1 signal peptide peptidase SppA [Pseudobdellovibrionaceae bacterium]